MVLTRVEFISGRSQRHLAEACLRLADAFLKESQTVIACMSLVGLDLAHVYMQSESCSFCGIVLCMNTNLCPCCADESRLIFSFDFQNQLVCSSTAFEKNKEFNPVGKVKCQFLKNFELYT